MKLILLAAVLLGIESVPVAHAATQGTQGTQATQAPHASSSAGRDERVAALRRMFEELAEAGLSASVLVTERDDVLLQAACGMADRAHGRVNRTDTIFDVGSITKQFTAAAILRLEEQKLLSTSDTLERFFAPVPADKRHIQIHHLLTHTSGLPPDVPVGSATTERDALIRACMAAKPASKPGEAFVYNNVGYMLLGAIVEIASKQRFEAYISEHLFTPAGMSSSGFLRTPGIDAARTACGYEGKTAFGPAEQGWYSWGLRGCGGVLSTTDDLLRWSRALQTDGVLSKRSRDKLFKPFLLDYAYGWWVRDDAQLGRTITHAGKTRGFEASLAHYADQDLRVIVLCNERGRCDAVARELALAAAGKRELQAELKLSQQELAAFAGEYEGLRGGKFVVRADGDALVLEPDTQAVIALVFGQADTKLERNAKLAKRADKLVDLLAARDAEGAQRLMSTEWPGWNRRMVGVWQGWLDERGKLERSECIGSKDDATLLQLVHERRSVLWLLRWKDEVLSSWTINGGLPEYAHYVARGPTEFAFEDTKGPASTRFSLTFERDASGAVRSLALAGAFVQVKAKRAR